MGTEKPVSELSTKELAEYAEKKFGAPVFFLAAEPDRLDHRDTLISIIKRQIEELRPAVKEYRGRKDLLADPSWAEAMLPIIREFEVLEEILKRARDTGVRTTRKTGITRIVLMGGDTVAKTDDQFFQWSETGKRMELWQDEPLRRIKYWSCKSVIWTIEAGWSVSQPHHSDHRE